MRLEKAKAAEKELEKIMAVRAPRVIICMHAFHAFITAEHALAQRMLGREWRVPSHAHHPPTSSHR